MRRYTHTVQLGAPPARAWHAAGEQFGDVARWAPGLAASRMANAHGVGVGGRRICTPGRPLFGMDEIVEEITEWAPPHRLAYRIVDPPFPLSRMASTWTFEARDGGTEVTIAVWLDMRGGRWMAPLAALAWRLKLRGIVEGGAEAFRDHVERAGGKPGQAPLDGRRTVVP